MKKVLVVDDDPILADLIAEFCRGAGFDAKSVNSGRQAIDLVRPDPADRLIERRERTRLTRAARQTVHAVIGH